jgi:magnesium-protoporphyrin O-methyltransferase
MTCCHRAVTTEQFDAAIARRDVRRFRRRGPDASTRELIRGILSRDAAPHPTLLDIGGGVGAIHHILLDRGFEHAIHVDASAAYLSVAQQEAERRGHAGRVQFQLAAFPREAGAVPAVDVVTLDRVVCCDPDYVGMLEAAAARARRLVAFSYPRERWLMRFVVAAANAVRRIMHRDYRAYVHPPERMRAVLERAGMAQSWTGGTWIWAVEIFERAR